MGGLLTLFYFLSFPFFLEYEYSHHFGFGSESRSLCFDISPPDCLTLFIRFGRINMGLPREIFSPPAVYVGVSVVKWKQVGRCAV